MRAIMVACDFTDILSVTLPYNRHHFSEVCVVTDGASFKELAPLCQANNADMLVTDLFYADGASFNKWRALEWALDRFGRHGWMVLMDADVLWPRGVGVIHTDKDLCIHFGGSWSMERGQLCSPLRRMMPIDHISLPISNESVWHTYQIHRNVNEWAGYTQIFHADDPVLGDPPWHQVDWVHAGGADSFFQAKWPGERKVRPPFTVLHLGDAGKNWYGRATPYLDGGEHPLSDYRKTQCEILWEKRKILKTVGRDPYSEERIRPDE